MRILLGVALAGGLVAGVVVLACSSANEETPPADSGADVVTTDVADTSTPTVDAEVDAAVVVYQTGFEGTASTCDGWTVVGGTAFVTEAVAASGTKSCRICMQTNSSVYIDILVPADKVAPYVLSASVRNESTSAFGSMAFTNNTDAGADAAADASPDFGTFKQPAPAGNEFKRLSITGTPTSTPAKVRLRFGAEKDGGLSCIDVDDVALTMHP